MEIIRDGKKIELTPSEEYTIFSQVQRKCLLEDAAWALEGARYMTQGLPQNLLGDSQSPYYILDEVVARFEDQQSNDVAANDTFESIIEDIASDMRERIAAGLVPFSKDRDTLEVNDEIILNKLLIEKNDDFQLEEDYVNFCVNGFSINVDKTFGLRCNTEDNDDYVNIYLNWMPDPAGFSESQMGSIQMAVIYQASNETREMKVNLSEKQQKVLLRRLPKMVKTALDCKLEDIFQEWKENA